MSTTPAPDDNNLELMIALGVVIPLLAIFFLLCVYCMIMGSILDEVESSKKKRRHTKAPVVVVDVHSNELADMGSNKLTEEIREEKRRHNDLLHRIETLEKQNDSDA